MSSIRRQTLSLFKHLHRTTRVVFEGDAHALSVARAEVNQRFKENKEAKSEEEAKKLLHMAEEADMLLR